MTDGAHAWPGQMPGGAVPPIKHAATGYGGGGLLKSRVIKPRRYDKASTGVAYSGWLRFQLFNFIFDKQFLAFEIGNIKIVC